MATQSELDGDCNDGDATVYEGADEICDETDNDCDGDVDEEAIVSIHNRCMQMEMVLEMKVLNM